MAEKRFPLLTFLAIILTILAVNEVACRLFLPAPERIITSIKAQPYSGPQHQDKKQLIIHEHPDEGGLYRGTPAGRRLNPNRHVTIENHRLSHQRVIVETNSIGYRNREIGAKPDDPNYRRILFLGDSVIFQDFFNDEDTIVRRVEMLAQQRQRPWETINAAVGAISLKTELAILLESGISLNPDVVLLNFYPNDFQESKGIDVVKVPSWMEHSRFLTQVFTALSRKQADTTSFSREAEKSKLSVWRQHFEQQRVLTPGLFNESPEAFNTLLRDGFSDIGGAWAPQAWDEMKPLLIEMKRLSIKHQFTLVIVFHPAYYQVYTEFIDDYPQQQMKQIASELQVPVLDLLPPLRAEALRLRNPAMYRSKEVFHDLFYDQCHHTPAGSAFIANEIYTFLDEQL